MLSTTYATSYTGIDAYKVTVECSTGSGLPSLAIVGLPDTTVKESANRIRSAMKNSGLIFPQRELTVNLAPADRRKKGSAFDLAILVAILSVENDFCGWLEKSCFIGEVSLSGKLRGTRAVLPSCIAARDEGLTRVFVPEENAAEGAFVEGIEVYPVDSIAQLYSHLTEQKMIAPLKYDPQAFIRMRTKCSADYEDVRGQDKAKRALEVAVAGGHNVMLIGPPGSGKTMLASRIPSILPEISFEEAIECSKIYSVGGFVNNKYNMVKERPFRAPHHTITGPGMFGGGGDHIQQVTPGEVSFAHNGVLFLDEFPEFRADAIEGLREIMESGVMTIHRLGIQQNYPASFMLVCAMNPCKCGYYGHPTRECTCKPAERKAYTAKISGPLIDRIDIQVEVSSVTYKDVTSQAKSEPSERIYERVQRAREFARKRYNGDAAITNATVNSALLGKHCRLNDESQEIPELAFKNLGLSARGYERILRVSRTIADLAGSEEIERIHVAEAVRYRSLDRKYWN